MMIIHNRQQDPLPEGQYGEKHHIIPKSCGGPNKKWNLVKLTPEEHYRVHCLLPEIYPNGDEHRAMVFAVLMMSRSRNGLISSEEDYARYKEEFATYNRGKTISEEQKKAISKAHKGVAPAIKGKKMSLESRMKMSLAKKGKPSWNKGIPKSPEQKEKIRMSVKAHYAQKLSNN